MEKNAPEDRRGILKNDIGRATAKLWNRFAAKAAKPEDIGFALELRQKLGIELEGLDQRMRFNAVLYDARRMQNLDAKGIQEAVNALPEDAKRLLAELDRTKSAEDSDSLIRQTIPRLQRLQDTYTRANKLDEALAKARNLLA